jgi:pyruvate dehydrogenase E1 component alpha subunit
MEEMTPADLIAFERNIADEFNRGAIRSPIHLSGGNEDPLIAYFANNYDAARGDWICTYWRSHYHILLSGIDPSRLKADILAGRSITLNYADRRIVSSAIVGGIVPIALGVALALKRQNSPARAHCFVGDMSAHTGAYHEARQYALGHDLPLSLVIEDNGKSVGTPTAEVWGDARPMARRALYYGNFCEHYYSYTLGFPHAGAGAWIKF